MRPKKKSKKKRPSQTSLSAQDETLIASILKDYQDSDPAQVVERIPDARIASALAERLPIKDESIIPLLSALKDSFQEKNVRRALKRILFKLERKGITLDGVQEERDISPAVLRRAQKEEPLAYLGPLDGMGFRSVLIELHRAAKGIDLGVGIVSDSDGIQQFIFANFSKKRTKQMKEELSRDVGPFVETSLSHAATILENAYQRHTEIHSDSPDQYLELRPWLLEHVSLLDRPVIYDFIDEAAVPGGDITDSQLEKLFRHRLMESWLLDFESLKPFMEDILKVNESPIVLDDVQKADRIRDIKKKGIEELFPEAKRALLKHRLEEMAYLFFKLGEEDSSRLALIAAAGVEQEETVLKTNRLLEYLFERSLHLYVDVAKGKDGNPENHQKENEPSIIVP